MDSLDLYLDCLKEFEKFQRDDFYQIGEELGYSLVSSNSILNDAISKGNLIPIDSVYLIRKDLFTMNDQLIQAVANYISDQLTPLGYLACRNQKGLRRKLPGVETYVWTVELLEYVAVHYLDYKRLIVKGMTFNTDPLILVKKDNNVTYNQLVILELNNYIGNMHLDNVGDYLYSKGLTALKNNQLPNQLFLEEVIETDSLGMVTLINFS